MRGEAARRAGVQLQSTVDQLLLLLYSQCNIAGSTRKQDVSVQLGDETGPATDCTFMGCRIRHMPLRADNAKRIRFIGCILGPPSSVSGPDAGEVVIL